MRIAICDDEKVFAENILRKLIIKKKSLKAEIMHNFAVMANNQDIKSTPCDPVIKYVLQFMEMKWSKRNPGHHFCKAWLYLAGVIW